MKDVKNIKVSMLAAFFCLSITCVSAGAGPQNLLQNPGFESGSGGWGSAHPGRYSVTTEVSRSGQAGLRYHKRPTDPKDENAHYDQVVKVEPHTLYLARAFFRSPSGLRPTLRIATMEWKTLAFEKADGAEDWQKVSLLFHSGDSQKVRFQIFGGATTGMRGTEPGTSYCDETMLRRVKKAERKKLSRARVEVDADSRTGQVDPLFFGVNTLFMIDDDAALADGQIAERLRDMPCRLLRYPGGEMADNYLWKPHRLDNDNRWPRVEGPQTTDTDEFMELCRQVGAEPIFVANLDSGLVKDNVAGAAENAAEWVRYCNEKHDYDVKYWEIGNETYLTGDRSGPVDPATYASAFGTFAEKMKQVDPDIHIGAVGPRTPTATGGSVPGKDRKPWWPTVVRRAGEHIDFAVVHWYVGGSHIDLRRLPSAVPRVDETMRTLDEFLRDRLGRSVPIALTEWNVNKRVNLRGMAAGVMLGELIGRFVEADVDMGTLWPMRYSGGRHRFRALLDRDSNEPRPMYRVMKLFASNLGNRLVECRDGAADLYSVASSSSRKNTVTVFVVNKPIIRDERSVTISLQGFSPRSARAVALQADDPQEGQVARRRVELTRTGDGYVCLMQPFSILVATFSK